MEPGRFRGISGALSGSRIHQKARYYPRLRTSPLMSPKSQTTTVTCQSHHASCATLAKGHLCVLHFMIFIAHDVTACPVGVYKAERWCRQYSFASNVIETDQSNQSKATMKLLYGMVLLMVLLGALGKFRLLGRKASCFYKGHNLLRTRLRRVLILHVSPHSTCQLAGASPTGGDQRGLRS